MASRSAGCCEAQRRRVCVPCASLEMPVFRKSAEDNVCLLTVHVSFSSRVSFVLLDCHRKAILRSSSVKSDVGKGEKQTMHTRDFLVFAEKTSARVIHTSGGTTRYALAFCVFTPRGHLISRKPLDSPALRRYCLNWHNSKRSFLRKSEFSLMQYPNPIALAFSASLRVFTHCKALLTAPLQLSVKNLAKSRWYEFANPV